MNPNLVIATRAARKAGNIMLQALERLDHLNVQEKKHNDFVTEIDVKAEQIIVEILQASFPNNSFLTEEQGEIWGKDRDTIWVIDPIDGTLNFMHGYPHFAVSIAKKVNGRVEQGLIYNPASQDVFTATKGEGALLNNRRLRVSKRHSLHGALIGMNFPRAGQDQAFQDKILTQLVPQVGAVRRTGSTALDLAFVAAGYLDGFICDHFQEWDVAAGLLLVREAGGMVTDLSGGDAILDTHSLVATNPKLLRALLTL